METEFAPVYFNSITKTLISSDKSIQEILYKIDNWINEGFGWVIESIEDEYFNTSLFSPLSGSRNIKLPNKLRNSKKGLINVKNNDNKYFPLCHIIHLNPLKTHPEKITEAD